MVPLCLFKYVTTEELSIINTSEWLTILSWKEEKARRTALISRKLCNSVSVLHHYPATVNSCRCIGKKKKK